MFPAVLTQLVSLILGLRSVPRLGKDEMGRPDPGPKALTLPSLPTSGPTNSQPLPAPEMRCQSGPSASSTGMPRGWGGGGVGGGRGGGVFLLPVVVHMPHSLFPSPSKAQYVHPAYHVTMLLAVSCWIYVLDYSLLEDRDCSFYSPVVHSTR